MAGFSAPVQAAEFDHDHAAWTRLLSEHVKDGRVDYSQWKDRPAAQALQGYLDTLSGVDESVFRQWAQPQQLAFLINLYNAATVRLILDHYPVNSIKNIGGWFSGPWSQKVVRVFGNVTTLGHIEHQRLRKDYREPRIHFAIVCGALGCPPLRPEAYVATRLEEQLQDQGRSFLSDTNKNWADGDTRTLHLSPLFKWFKSDFTASGGSVQAFVAPYLGLDVAPNRLLQDWSIRYTDYDWALNRPMIRD
jgi:hypothetical protein